MTERPFPLLGAAMLGAGLGLVGTTIVARPLPRFVWNASASAPVGLYAVTPGAPVKPGDMVIARLPPRYRMFAARRHYLPANVPLVKRVAAVSGSQVCALGPSLFLDGSPLADRRRRDGAGRRMPWWEGCVRLGRGQVFLLMPGNANSFDGRYFGVSDQADIIGKARLLWAR